MRKTFITIICGLLTLALVGFYFSSKNSNNDENDPTTQELTSAEIVANESAEKITTEEIVSTGTITAPSTITETQAITPIINSNEQKCIIIDDFTNGVSQLQWYAVNDGVMGGLSQGTASLEENALVHTGVINTNGGGFSYVGTRLPSNALVGYNKLQVRLNTYGRTYAVNFNDTRYWRVTHQSPIPKNLRSEWQEVFITFDETTPTIFSQRVNSEPFKASAINELSFILSDGIDGSFRTEIDWIKACV